MISMLELEFKVLPVEIIDIAPLTIPITASIQWIWQIKRHVATCPVCDERIVGDYTEAHNHVNNHEWACGPAMRFQFAPFALIPGGEL